MTSGAKHSFHRLIAELAALPLGSEIAFNHAFDFLPSNLESEAESFYTESEKLAPRYGATTNELAQIRDWVWWDGRVPDPRVRAAMRRQSGVSEQPRLYLENYLLGLANKALTFNGATLLPWIHIDDPRNELIRSNWGQYSRESLEWLGRSMPLDLLETAIDPKAKIQHLDARLRRSLVEEGFGETHLHLGASVSFPHQWQLLQATLRIPGLHHEFLKTPHGIFGGGKRFGTWVMINGLGRIALAKFLFGRHDHADFADFFSKLTDELARQNADSTLLAMSIASLGSPLNIKQRFSQVRFCRLQALLNHLTDYRKFPASCVLDVQRNDPICRYVQAVDGEDPENRFVHAAIRYLSRSKVRDARFAKLFWQTQRIRTLFYRHLVQQQDTGGLVWFTRYYRRISPTRRSAIRDRTQLILGAINGGVFQGLTSFEVRGAPSSNPQSILEDLEEIRIGARLLNDSVDRPDPIRAIAKAGNSRGSDAIHQFRKRKIEVGLVYHFVKERERNDPDVLSISGKRTHGIITDDAQSKFRYGDFAAKTDRKAKAVARTLREYPLSLLWLRGIDICNDEMAVPTWIFVKPFNEIAAASRYASGYLHKRFGVRVSPVSPSSHAGEDFGHLLTGLRRVEEAVRLLGLKEGHRIGHGLALGIEPRQWCDQSGVIAMTKETRLLDLIWKRWFGATLADAGLSVDASRDDTELHDLIGSIFGANSESNTDTLGREAPRIHDIELLYMALGNPTEMDRLGFPRALRPNAEVGLGEPRASTQRLLRRYLTDDTVTQRAMSIKMVDAAREADGLRTLQHALRSQLAAKGIAVEVNPTSNVVVGGFEELSEHPIWSLNSPGPNNDVPCVSVCVGSDDPLVFSTDLRQEYQRLKDALRKRGHSETEVDAWIDQVRRKSLEVRSTVSEVSFLPIKALKTSYQV